MRTVLGLLFVAVALTIVAAIHGYIWVRMIRDTGLPPQWRTVATVALIGLGVSVPVTMILSHTLPFRIARVVLFAPFCWMGLLLLVLTALVGWDLVQWAIALTWRAMGEGPLDPGRRQWLARVGAAAVTATALGGGALAVAGAARFPVVRRLEVALSKLPPGMDGFTIVQLSDLHLGITLGSAWLKRVVETTNALQPDLVAITGDLVDGTVRRVGLEVQPIAQLRARFGTYFVTGNHEYYAGVAAWLPVLEQYGIRVLRNEHVWIEKGEDRFVLVGVDDYNAGGMAPGHGPDLTRALAGVPSECETVLLAHQPRAVVEASRRDVGLVLSGHTHGGQIWPWHHLIRVQQPYRFGLHRHGARTQVHVTAGTGYWGPPMRLGTRGEIVVIVLRSERRG